MPPPGGSNSSSSSGSDDEGGSRGGRRSATASPAIDGLNPEALPALFWDHMPEAPEAHPDYAGLMAIADECTPEERAESFKKQGNKKLEMGLKAKNRLLLREAIALYGRGLELKCGSSAVDAALRNNRAHVHALLGNWRSSLEDAAAALSLTDGVNPKAAYRAARAAFKLGRLDEAGAHAEAGLKADPSSPELLRLREELTPAREAAAARAAAAAAEEAARLAPARALAAALTAAGYALTRPQSHGGGGAAARRPRLRGCTDSGGDTTANNSSSNSGGNTTGNDGSGSGVTGDGSGVVLWPVTLVYPETMARDVVEEWPDCDAISDHLDHMFGPGAPPLPWDEGREYTRDAVELYYLANAGAPLTEAQLVEAMAGRWPSSSGGGAGAGGSAGGASGSGGNAGIDADDEEDDDGPSRYGPKAAKWVKVDEAQTLRQALTAPGHIVPGAPLFFVVARGTEYRERFLEAGRR